jgi:hypothetical protein
MTITVAPSPGSLALTTRYIEQGRNPRAVAGLQRGSQRDRDPSPAPFLRAPYASTRGLRQ